MNIQDEFYKTLGKPKSEDLLNEYISFIENNEYESGICEIHHILPRCKFPEFLYTPENLIKLSIEDHKKAHFLLAKAYPICSFIYPLNWMHDTEETYKEYLDLKSHNVKEWWIEFKTTEQYEYWRQNKSISARNHIMNDDHAVNITEAVRSKYSKEEIFEINSKGGKSEIRIEKHKKAIRAYYDNPDNVKAKSIETKNRWDTMSDDDRHNFSNTMSSVNKCEKKRASAGVAIKEKWKDPEYIKAQTVARNAANTKLKESGEKRLNSNAMKAKWADPIWKENTLHQRKLKRELKKYETDKCD